MELNDQDVENTSSIQVDCDYPDSPLLIVFGGMLGQIGSIPPFEFLRMLKDLKVNKIFVRDLEQCWYHAGLKGYSNNIEESVEVLRQKVLEANAKKVVTLGNSSGAYAAILFGTLLEVETVHAFAPHTVLHDIELVRSKDKLISVHKNYPDTFYDLKKIIKEHSGKTKIKTYHDINLEMDSVHALHLRELPNVSTYAFDEGGHSMTRHFRDNGELIKIIKSEIHS